MPDFPTASEVLNLHRNSDLDKRRDAQHHSLGRTRYQASPGDHNHDGGSSSLLIPVGSGTNGDFKENIGAYSGGANGGIKESVKQLIQLFTALGVTDNTTDTAPNTTTFNQNLGLSQGQKDVIKAILGLIIPMGARDLTTVGGSWPDIRTGTINPTWTVAGNFSSSTAFTWSTPFTATPACMMNVRSTNLTYMLVPRMSAGVGVNGTSCILWSSVSQSIGFSASVDYLAINMVPYT